MNDEVEVCGRPWTIMFNSPKAKFINILQSCSKFYFKK